MSIIATCLCGKQFRVPDEAAGQVMTCPMCATTVLVPSVEVGRSTKADDLPQPGQLRCVDCNRVFWPVEMLNDGGELVCKGCFENGPPRKPMNPKVMKGLLISAGVMLFVAANGALTYYFFVVNT